MYQTNNQYTIFTPQPSRLEYIVGTSQEYSSSNTYTLETSPIQHHNYEFGTIAFPQCMPYNSMQGNSVQHYSSQNLSYTLFTPQLEYHFNVDHFLKPGKEGIFVGKAEEIRPFIEDAFEKMFQQSFPADIKISLCSQTEFRKIAPSVNTVGISFNRKRQGLLSEIFVLNDSLGRVLLTVGHELGHVLTESVENSHDEEAKAFAFSFAWMNIIQEHNIAGLGEAIITESPAENGLHNIAFQSVQNWIVQGISAWEIYLQILRKNISIFNNNN